LGSFKRKVSQKTLFSSIEAMFKKPAKLNPISRPPQPEKKADRRNFSRQWLYLLYCSSAWRLLIFPCLYIPQIVIRQLSAFEHVGELNALLGALLEKLQLIFQ
jgi:hypothetical protein